jgi:mRNA (guanine-N7-)-methyltransferase
MNHRNQSNFINMRSKHNLIKLELIKNTVGQIVKRGSVKDPSEINLLDISIGRFGDLHSYNKSKIGFVHGIDIDIDSINEANNRFSNSGYKFKCLLEVKPIIDFYADVPKYNIVVCNFTLHYFFKTEIMFRTIMKNISSHLKSGGFFIGTTIDGSLVKEYLPNTDNQYFSMYTNNSDNNGSFGCEYYFNMKDNKESGIYSKVDPEYLTDLAVMVKIANENNMKIISSLSFKKYPYDGNMFPWEMQISGLYRQFIFEKM